MTDIGITPIRNQEYLATDLIRWEVGPFNDAFSGPMKVRLKLDGEIIVWASVETGYAHKGLEKSMERHKWSALVPYSDHLDPSCAIHAELALCQAVEELLGIEVPKRARTIRVLMSELNRICVHMEYVARLARSVGSETTVHYILRDREKLLDIFELLTGARFSLNFLRFGGVACDVSEGGMERVLDACDMIRARIKEYNDLFSFNYAFMKRAAGTGILTQEMVAAFGVTGPNGRASGVPFDIRKAHPYSGYDKLDFKSPLGVGDFGIQGDCHERFIIRLREINESIEIIRQCTEGMPFGEFRAEGTEKIDRVPKGEAYSRVEAPRGLLSCYVASEGGERPARVQFRTPSTSIVEALSELMVGSRLEDLPVIVSSFDVNLSEVDK